MFKNTVSELMSKGKLVRIGPDDSVRDACRLMDEEDVGAVLVCDSGQMLGVLSERDVIRKCICASRPTAETRARDIMTVDPITTTPEAPVAEAFTKMLVGGFRHLPVVEGSGPVGMLSMRDIPTENRLLVERYIEYTDSDVATTATA